MTAFIQDYVVPPIAAAAGVVPVFYGFAVKSAQQLGTPIPRMTIAAALKGGCHAAPSVGLLVGTQLAAQKLIENQMGQKNDDLKVKVASAAFVGLCSAVPIAIFNGKTMGKSVAETWANLRLRQVGAIVGQETCFVLSLCVRDPVKKYMKEEFGDRKSVEYGASFMCGAIGSAFGHPFNTILTRWQNNMAVNWRQLMRGMPIKAITVGAFFCTNNSVEDAAKALLS